MVIFGHGRDQVSDDEIDEAGLHVDSRFMKQHIPCFGCAPHNTQDELVDELIGQELDAEAEQEAQTSARSYMPCGMEKHQRAVVRPDLEEHALIRSPSCQGAGWRNSIYLLVT